MIALCIKTTHTGFMTGGCFSTFWVHERLFLIMFSKNSRSRAKIEEFLHPFSLSDTSSDF